MAQKVQTIYISDLSGKELGEDGRSVRFGHEGVNYEIDLSPQEADEFAATMQRYVDAGRRVGGRRQNSIVTATATGGKSQAKVIKAWLDEQGLSYPRRGRLPRHLVEQWEAAHQF